MRRRLSRAHSAFRLGQLTIRSLKTPFHRGLGPALRFGTSHKLTEEIRIAAEIARRCERNCVDALLEGPACGRRKVRDAMCERSDEFSETFGRRRSINPAVALGQLRIIIVRTQQHFERAATPHEARVFGRRAWKSNALIRTARLGVGRLRDDIVRAGHADHVCGVRPLARRADLERTLHGVGVAAVVLAVLGGTTWASSGFWAPDGAYSRFISPIVGLSWAMVVSRVLLKGTPPARTGW